MALLKLKAESYRRGIVQSSAVNVTGKVIAFIQQWLIGFYFGSHSDTDLFFFTYNIVLFISYFFLNLTTSVIIPECIKLRNRQGEKVSEGFVNSFILIYCVAGLLLTLSGILWPEELMTRISSFEPDVVAGNIPLIRWCFPLIFLTVFVNLLTEVLASYKYFTMPNLVNAVNSVLAVIFVVVFHDNLGLASVAAGLLAGALINAAIILLMMKKSLKWNFGLFEFFKVKNVFSYGIYAQLGFLVYLAALYVPQYLFSDFSEGSLTAMNYADKIANIPGIFLITQLTNVMAIKFNNLVSEDATSKIATLAEKLLLYVSVGLLLLAVLMSASGNWIVNLLFGMIGMPDTFLSLTSSLLSLMMLYLPVGFAYNIFMRIFNSYSKQNYVLFMQVFTQGLVILLYYLFIPVFGELSFPVLRLLPYSATTLLAILVFGKLCKEFKTRKMFLCYMLIVAVVLGISLWLLH